MNRVILIHGMWGCAQTLGRVCQYFETLGFRVDCPELPDHGPAAGDSVGALSVRDYCQYLIESADIDENCLLLGHSMGGLLAQMIAVRIPVRGLILLATAGPHGTNCFHMKSAISTSHAWSRWRFWQKPHRPSRWLAKFALWNLLSDQRIDQLYPQLRWESGRAMAECVFWMFDPYRSIDIDLQQITAKTLMVAGRHDHIIVPSISNKLAKRLPDCEYHLLANHAHWLFDEPGSDQVYELIHDWLNRNQLITADSLSDSQKSVAPIGPDIKSTGAPPVAPVFTTGQIAASTRHATIESGHGC